MYICGFALLQVMVTAKPQSHPPYIYTLVTEISHGMLWPLKNCLSCSQFHRYSAIEPDPATVSSGVCCQPREDRGRWPSSMDLFSTWQSEWLDHSCQTFLFGLCSKVSASFTVFSYIICGSLRQKCSGPQKAQLQTESFPLLRPQ